ncbi:Transposon TX1 uncharacterized 149 kDa protein [Vitis vinifera]|uniref:Transposon TX1 uncharacterized 149 kDa protein n=1 Tax=Vitis vinifera TaxID=29760 RepID=A0A438DSI0_VITVI|nr:Transposon TX1 uncharacterized 149 kDa protein [Vitis vinifera]
MEGLVPPPGQKQNHHTAARKIVSSASLTDLWLLVREGSLADVDLALVQLKKNGGNINSRNSFGLTPLHIATWRNHIPIVRRLLAAGADPDARDGESGWSSLHRALHFGHLAVASILLQSGASITLEDSRSRIPVDLVSGPVFQVVGSERDSVATELFSWGSGVNYQLGTGNTHIQKLPCKVDSLHGTFIKSVSAAKFHSVAVSARGEVYTWGFGRGGRLGHPEFDIHRYKSAISLDAPFIEEEIAKAIFQMNRDKAPGPDGFTIAVFQNCWDVIKEDLSTTKKILDFRPISLITSLYKIIAKVLSGRLRGVLHETIHSTQDAFVQGRQIMDAVLIANEIVDERRRSGEEGVVFKIDFEKAYDHVRWDFLDQVLEKKGFSPKWRKWMSGCLFSVSYAVLVNGSAKGWVKALRGLRQGDPLSSFLFTLVADVLSRMLLRAEERNMLEGFRVGRNRTRVSHLQFADDTIFFSNTREEDLQTLKSLLLAFGHISGLKVNLDKSNIYGINLDQAHISRLAETLECKASGWPILYLGLPFGGNPGQVDFGIQ